MPAPISPMPAMPISKGPAKAPKDGFMDLRIPKAKSVMDIPVRIKFNCCIQASLPIAKELMGCSKDL